MAKLYSRRKSHKKHRASKRRHSHKGLKRGSKRRSFGKKKMSQAAERWARIAKWTKQQHKDAELL